MVDKTQLVKFSQTVACSWNFCCLIPLCGLFLVHQTFLVLDDSWIPLCGPFSVHWTFSVPTDSWFRVWVSLVLVKNVQIKSKNILPWKTRIFCTVYSPYFQINIVLTFLWWNFCQIFQIFKHFTQLNKCPKYCITQFTFSPHILHGGMWWNLFLLTVIVEIYFLIYSNLLLNWFIFFFSHFYWKSSDFLCSDSVQFSKKFSHF